MDVDYPFIVKALLAVIALMGLIIWKLLNLLREFHNDALFSGFGPDDDDDDDEEPEDLGPEIPSHDRYFSLN